MALRHGRSKIGLYLTFCRGFSATSIIITVVCLSLVLRNGPEILAPVFIYKAIVVAITVYFIDTAKRKEYYYYSNLGLSKRRLWGTVVAADMLLFLLLTLAAVVLAPAANMP